MEEIEQLIKEYNANHICNSNPYITIVKAYPNHEEIIFPDDKSCIYRNSYLLNMNDEIEKIKGKLRHYKKIIKKNAKDINEIQLINNTTNVEEETIINAPQNTIFDIILYIFQIIKRFLQHI